jgi:hypothetical protein
VPSTKHGISGKIAAPERAVPVLAPLAWGRAWTIPAWCRDLIMEIPTRVWSATPA